MKKYYLRQFSLFAWTHVALLCVVTQSYLIIQNMFEGLIWFIMPICMVIINDIMAYMFGFTMGRTPLIQLSPKKTWEGFIGRTSSSFLDSCCLEPMRPRMGLVVLPLFSRILAALTSCPFVFLTPSPCP